MRVSRRRPMVATERGRRAVSDAEDLEQPSAIVDDDCRLLRSSATCRKPAPQGGAQPLHPGRLRRYTSIATMNCAEFVKTAGGDHRQRPDGGLGLEASAASRRKWALALDGAKAAVAARWEISARSMRPFGRAPAASFSCRKDGLDAALALSWFARWPKSLPCRFVKDAPRGAIRRFSDGVRKAGAPSLDTSC